jgi:ectoine hydroxylase-related dioxygenase (phytanoyl-CoA dioxygenase family)
MARGRIFEKALMAEKRLALITWLLGESCELSSNHGHVRVEGDPEQELHVDAPLVPEPLPVAAVSCNSMWATDYFTKESGATLVVPGSHKRLCSPPANAKDMAVPVLAKKGSVIVFNGNIRHGAGARTVSGERVGMTMYFNRMYVRPQEDLANVISDEVLARNPPRFAHLVGMNNPYPARDFNFFNPKGAAFQDCTKDQRG